MSSDWNMPRRAEECVGCRRVFEIGETFRALLYASDAGYERRDYCLACQPPPEPAPIGSWRTRRPEPTAKKIQPFDREAIYGFFERLENASTLDQIQFRFVLALLLWRKKALKMERTIDEGGREVWEFIAPRSGVLHRIVRPDLDEQQLERLSLQLEQLLAGQPGELDIVATDLGKEGDHD